MIFLFLLWIVSLVLYVVVNAVFFVDGCFESSYKYEQKKRKLDYVIPGYLLGYNITTWLNQPRGKK